MIFTVVDRGGEFAGKVVAAMREHEKCFRSNGSRVVLQVFSQEGMPLGELIEIFGGTVAIVEAVKPLDDHVCSLAENVVSVFEAIGLTRNLRRCPLGGAK